MDVLMVCALISSVSFLAYAFSYFNAPHMREEFKRFGLERLGLMTVILEIAGALGLLVGLRFHLILIVSSLGLALLMFAGVIVRIKMKDSLLVSLPAFFYLILNGYIFWMAINVQT